MVKDIATADDTLKNHFFPNLKTDKYYRTTSDKTDRYNCIAWAMFLTDRWVQPSVGSNIWWPRYHDLKFDRSCDGLIEAFRVVGFELCADNSEEKHYDKVALYYEPSTKMWTHAARVLSSKEYHSKAGSFWDFHHDSHKYRLLNVSDINNSYGEVYAFMKRRKYMRFYSLYLMIIRFLQKMFIQPFTDIVNLISY